MTPRIGLCGAGMIAGAHAAAAAHLGYPVVAVASRTDERAGRLAGAFRSRAVAYDQLPGEADLVVVATPPHRHADDAIRMLQAGAAVLLEKPLCRTLEEADRLVQAVDEHGGRLLYGENLAYSPVILQMVSMARSVGTPTHLEVRSMQGLPTWGAFTTREWGGGALFDLGVHPLAVAMLLGVASGLGRVVAVEAELRGGEGHDSDEHAEVLLRFANGFTGRVVASWQAGPDPHWDAQLAGDHGVVRAELLPQQTLEFNGDDVALPKPRTNPPLLETLGYAPQLQALADDVANGREPAMSAAFGREVLHVVLAAYASAGAAEAVAVPFTGPRDRTPLELWRR